MEDLMKRLNDIAWLKSVAFCYQCYLAVTSCACTVCGSDDNMRMLPGVGCEHGLDWIVRHLIEENLQPVDLDEAFEEFVSECYSENVKVAWLNVDVATAARKLDPVSWDLAQSEWVDVQVSDERMITFDHGESYYWANDVEQFIESQESLLEETG